MILVNKYPFVKVEKRGAALNCVLDAAANALVETTTRLFATNPPEIFILPSLDVAEVTGSVVSVYGIPGEQTVCAVVIRGVINTKNSKIMLQIFAEVIKPSFLSKLCFMIFTFKLFNLGYGRFFTIISRTVRTVLSNGYISINRTILCVFHSY